MNNVKKNNKGFSLVELIVVVLIMAIIAVALAPQVMKWVDNSRIATDRQTADSVVSFAQLALTNKAANDAVSAAEYQIVIDGTDCTIQKNTAGAGAAASYSDVADTDAFLVAFCSNAGVTAANPVTAIKMKSGNTVTISIDKTGLVTSNAGTALDSADLD